MSELQRRELLALGGAATGAPAHLQTVEVNGATLAYRRFGPGGRPPLVFQHGYALRSTGEIYAPLMQRLAERFEVYALDMRGHGGSAAAVDGWSQAAVADDLAAFTKALNLERPVYAGHSLGGFTGLYAEIRHPGTFSALAVLATAAAAGGPPLPEIEKAFVENGRDRDFAAKTFAGMYRRPNPADVGRAAEALTLVDPAVHRAFYPSFSKVVIADQLPQVRVPVLLVNGGRDNVIPPEDQHRTAQGLALSKEVIFSTEGHMLPIEAPEATAREIVDFINHDVSLFAATAA